MGDEADRASDNEVDAEEDFQGDLEEDFIDLERDGDDDDFPRIHFADPGSGSALRAASPTNPRNLPCPTCGEPNRLTLEDRARSYRCNECADQAEGKFC